MQPTLGGCSPHLAGAEQSKQAAAQNKHFPAHCSICARLAADSAVTSHNLPLLVQAYNSLFFGNDCTVYVVVYKINPLPW